MRDIKFRAKNKNNKWVYGTGIVQVEINTYDSDKWELIQKVNYDELDYFQPLYETEDIDIKTLGEYTGLKDKNGKEIYEGDIVLDYNTKYIVRYEPLRGGFFPFACGDGCGCCDDEVVYNSKDVKIIGNIYDNQELVKEIENQKNI